MRDSYVESPAMKQPGVFRTEALGNIACHAASENKEKGDSGDGLLNDMRTWLHESGTNLLKANQVQKWREYYPALFHNMDSIHQSAMAADPENSPSDYAPGALLANCVRYLHSNNLGTELTFEQLTALYEAYSSDVQLCRDIKVPDPERIACRHGRQSLSRLIDAYGAFEFVRGDDFVKAISRHAESPEIYFERLIRNVTYFQTVSEPALREMYGVNGEAWSATFIASLSRRFPNVEQAARDIFELMPKLRSAYKYASEATVERWAKQIITEQKSERRMEIDELLADVPVITIENSARELAVEGLSRLRDAVLSDKIRVSASRHVTASVHRLVRIAEANWHESFEEVDMPGAARNIYFMIKAYNDLIKKTKTDAMPPIAMTAASLYTILVAFTSDINALKKEVAPSRAARVACYYSPGICERLHEQFQDKDVPVSVIGSLIVHKSPKEIVSTIEEYIERRDTLKEMLKTEKLVGLHMFARLDDGLERARKYLAFLPKAREHYHWVGRSDVAEFFYNSSSPVDQFNAWAEKVEAIRGRTNLDANRTSINFPSFVIKILARDKEHSVDTIIKTHIKRCDALYMPYRDNSFVTRAMVPVWVTRRAIPEDAIKEHLKRVNEVRELLVRAGEDDQDIILVRDLAFYNSNPQKMVARYLDIKKMLEVERETWSEELSDVEPWMIVQVASRSSRPEYARRKLRVLSWIARLRELQTTSTYQQTQLIEKTAAEKDYRSSVDLNQVAALLFDL